MPENTVADQTLPSVIASPELESQKRALTLTIVFHPDTRRIGEIAQFEKCSGKSSSLLGRALPAFKHPDNSSAARPLSDPYISKQALQVRYSKGSVLLRRDSSSSRAQVGGVELSGETRLSRAQLEVGVPILLGGRVVLLLRRTLRFKPSSQRGLCFSAMMGSSAYMANLREQITQLANAKLDILIRGETGTGKELVAEAVHAASDRASKKMVAVNMAAIPDALGPALLFGSAKGAFTGADKAAAGYFQQAEGGTLFLDEIGDTPAQVQAQLLRALQQREIQTVGGAIKTVDVRVISATDAQLDDQSCNFKAALRHRLAESEIALLPLRQHPEDIGELLWVFLQKNMAALGQSHVLPQESSRANEIARWAELFHRFVAYSWPGNIRELSNCAQQVASASDVSAVIPDIVTERFSETSTSVRSHEAIESSAPVQSSEDYSDQEFHEGLRNARYEVLRTARQLGISRQAVYRRISESPDLCLASDLSDEQIRAALRDYPDDLTATAMQLRVSRTALRGRLRSLSVSG